MVLKYCTSVVVYKPSMTQSKIFSMKWICTYMNRPQQKPYRIQANDELKLLLIMYYKVQSVNQVLCFYSQLERVSTL